MVTQFPTLDSGVTYLDDEGAPAALYRLVGSQLGEAAGPAYWVDARNAARPDAIDEYTSRRSGRSLRIARAFTAFQHYELVRSLPATVSPRTSLVVVPNVASLYATDDVPGHEADAMFEATLSLLDGVAEALDVPVVVTASERTDRVAAAADRTLSAAQTQAGLRVDGPSFRTDVYWHDWGIQTTIPYWVELVGAVGADGEQTAVDPVALGV
jgi:RecA/RadA recombinase